MSQYKGPSTKRKVQSRKAARQWLDQGISVVPIKPNSKRPKSGKGWNTLRIEPITIAQYFTLGDNVGGLWGEASDWIVDVDLDWDEACDIAPKLLPETFIYGRTKRPGSHYLYRCRGAISQKWTLKTGEVILELRSSGSQSVLPPSIHPEGDRYNIDHDVEFEAIEKIALERALDEVAGAALLIRNYPTSGSRHDYIHSITGSLMHSGWGDKKTKKFMEAFLVATEHLDTESGNRSRTVTNTIDHFKQGDRIQGWRSLSQFLDGEHIKALKKWLTPTRHKFETPPGATTTTTSNTVADKPISEIPPFDPRLCDIDGLVGDLAAWNKRSSFLLQPSFDLTVGLMGTAIASTNKYVVQGWNTPLQPYLMILAPTAAGKGAALSSIYKFATKIGLQDFAYQGFQSYYVMLDRLAESPNMACWLWDEAARHLASARNPASPDYIILSHLISLYGRANDHVPGSPGRKNSIPPLTHPFLTLLATAQPSQLIDAISSAEIATGFINRLVLFDSGDLPPKPNLNRSDVLPSKMLQAAKALKAHEPREDFTMIAFDTPTYVTFQDFDNESRRKAALGDEFEIWGRANQNALMLAGLVAIGQNPKRPHINKQLADWAIKIIEWSISCWMLRLGQNVSTSKREKQSKRVEGLIRKSRGLSHRARGRYQKTMKEGLMPRTILMRLSRDLTKRELDDILDQLVEAGVIGQSEESGFVTYWAKN